MPQTMRALGGLALAGVLAACAPPGQTEATGSTSEPEVPIAGHINGEAVSETLLDVYATARFRTSLAELSPEQLGETRNDFARLFVLAQEGKRQNVDKDPAITMQILNILAQTTLGNKAKNAISEEDVKARFEQLLNSGEARELKARHILVKTEDEAKAAITELDGGADFQELAKTRSTDEASAANGGDLGWFGYGRMVQPFWEAALALEAGSYTADPVNSPFGWHVVLLEQSRDQPFAQAEEQLRRQMTMDFVNGYVKELTGAANISWVGQTN